MFLSILFLLTSAPAPTVVIEQEFRFDGIDVLAGDTVPYHVDPFDTSLGTLIDVRTVMTGHCIRSKVVIPNHTGQFFYSSDLATGLTVVPWTFADDWSKWSSTSSGSSFFVNCGSNNYKRPVVPPHSAFAYRGGCCQTDIESPVSWIHFGLPGIDYWADTTHPNGHNLRIVPAYSYACYFANSLREWPWDTPPVRLIYSMTWRIEYEYEPW